MPEPPVTGSPNSSVRGEILPGPGIFRFSFTLASAQNYWNHAAPTDGQGLDDFFQQLVAGITNLPSQNVRPRWQDEPDPLPAWGTDWAAVGVTSADLDAGYAWEGDVNNPGTVASSNILMEQHEIMTLLVSCYGPHADWYDGLLRDGFAVDQNREVLTLAAMGLIEVGGQTVVPELVNQRWLRRIDRQFRIHRQIRRAYPVLSILQAAVGVEIDSGPAVAG